MENVKNKGTTNDRLIAKEQRIMRLKELKIISRFAAKGLISFSTILVGLRTEHWVSSSAAKRRDESLLFLDFRLEGFDIDGGDTSGRGGGASIERNSLRRLFSAWFPRDAVKESRKWKRRLIGPWSNLGLDSGARGSRGRCRTKVERMSDSQMPNNIFNFWFAAWCQLSLTNWPWYFS